MELTAFFKAFLRHSVMAAGLFFLCVVALERLLPGFVAPFINLPELGLAIFVLSALSLWFSPEGDLSSAGKLFSWFIFVAVAVPSILFAYTRLNYSAWHIGLLAAVIVLVTTFIYIKK